MKKQLVLLISLFVLFLSTNAFADSSIGDAASDISNEALLTNDVSSILGTDHLISRSPYHGGSYHQSSRVVRRTTYRTNYRPRYYAPVSPVVVVHPTPVVSSSTSVAAVSSSSSASIGKYSIGFRVLGLAEAESNIDGICFEDLTYGGVGLYFRARPIRFLGIELASDILVNTKNDYRSYKVPVTLGIMGHVFDYGIFDLYGIIAGGAIFNTVNYPTNYNVDEKFVQFTGQFGAGVGLDLSGFEIFLDVRYSLTQARPATESSNLEFYRGSTDKDVSDKVTHGILFMLGMGFST